jgi:hypothetical protein
MKFTFNSTPLIQNSFKMLIIISRIQHTIARRISPIFALTNSS